MIVPQAIYHPLYTDSEKFIILITGGRGSGKSFNASTFIERLTFEMTPTEKIVHQILYTRYTMVSAGMSIIPEMMEKIDLDGTTKYFKTTKTDIVNRLIGWLMILFIVLIIMPIGMISSIFSYCFKNLSQILRNTSMLS